MNEPEKMKRIANTLTAEEKYMADTSGKHLQDVHSDVTITNYVSDPAQRKKEQDLISAVEEGDFSRVRACLQDPHCDVNATDDNGSRILVLAAERADLAANNAQIVRELLAQQRVEVNKTDHVEWALFDHGAVSLPSLAAVELLVNCRKCDVNASWCDTGYTVLMWAARCVQSDDDDCGKIIKLLLTRDDIDTSLADNSVGGGTAIQYLCRQDIFQNASFNACPTLYETISLLASRSNPNADSNKHTFAEAVSYSIYTVCEILLKHGFSPNDVMEPTDVISEADLPFGTCYCEGRETALHRAVRLNSLSKSTLLLKHGANLTTIWRGLTPLELAIAYNARPEILELLSKDMSKCEIAKAIEKCSMVGESVQECVMRLGVPAWTPFLGFSEEKHSVFKCTGILNEASSKLVANKPTTCTTCCPENALLSVIDCRGNFQSAESQLILQDVIALLEALSDSLSDCIPGLKFEPVLAGSMAEGTKVYLPNEVDVMCVLGPDFTAVINSNCELDLVVSNQLPKCVLHGENYLDCFNMVGLFYSAVEFALETIIRSSKPSGKLRLFKKSLIWCDKVSRLQLMWNGEEFKNMMISVDLAVCVRVDKETADSVHMTEVLHKHILKQLNFKEHFMICKSARCAVDSSPMLSTSTLEKEILNHMPINVKRGLILAKAVRIASIAKPDEDLSTTFCLAEDVHIDDLISSHMLKSCFMFGSGLVAPKLIPNPCDYATNVEQYIPQSPNYCESPQQVAIGIYANLKQQLERRVVYSWVSRIKDEGMLVDCGQCKFEYSCCMKRKLMLAMTQKILQWLQDNDAQLQDIDYADSVDHCDVKTLVYRRQDVPEVLWKATSEESSSCCESVRSDSFSDTNTVEGYDVKEAVYLRPDIV